MAERLDDAARGALARARDLASQHKHESVDVDHALLALLGEPSVRQRVEEMAVSPEELGARLRAALAARVVAAGYRDGAPPQRTARLEDAVKRASPSGPLRLFRKATPLQLFLALPVDSDVAQRLFDARLSALSISTILEHAALLAAARGDPIVLVEHALIAVSDSEWLGEAFERLHVSRERFVDALDAILRSDPSSKTYAGFAMNLTTFAAQNAIDVRGASVEAIAFVAQIVRSPLSEPLFDYAGIGRFDLLRALVGRATPDSRSLPEDGLLDVVFHNDHLTTMEFVVETLRESFGLANQEALVKMLQVHQAGTVVIGTFPAPEAKQRTRDAMDRARRSMMPLQITLRPPDT